MSPSPTAPPITQNWLCSFQPEPSSRLSMALLLHRHPEVRTDLPVRGHGGCGLHEPSGPRWDTLQLPGPLQCLCPRGVCGRWPSPDHPLSLPLLLPTKTSLPHCPHPHPFVFTHNPGMLGKSYCPAPFKRRGVASFKILPISHASL